MKIELLQEFYLQFDGQPKINFWLKGQYSVQSPPHVGMVLRVPDEIDDVENGFWHLNYEHGQEVESVQMVAIKRGIYTHSARLPVVKSTDKDSLIYHGHEFFEFCLEGTTKWYHNTTNTRFTNFLANHGKSATLHDFDPAEKFFQSLIALTEE